MSALVSLISMLLQVYMWIVIIRAVLSWVRPNPYNPIVRFICRLVDPVTYRISRIIPTRVGMVDLSPIVLMVLIMLVRQFIVGALVRASMGL